MQSKIESFREACEQVTIGYLLSLITQSIVYPMYHMHATLWVNVQITAIFTMISLARQYIVRRRNATKSRLPHTFAKRLAQNRTYLPCSEVSWP